MYIDSPSTPPPPNERRLGMLAGAAIVVGALLLAVSFAWPSLARPRAVVASPGFAVPAQASTPAPAAKTPDSTVATVVDRTKATTSTSTAASAASGAGETSITATVVTVAPPSTVALPPFVTPTLPPVNIAATPRQPNKPIVVGVANGVTDLNPHVVSRQPTDNAAVMANVLPSPFRAGGRGEAVLDQDLLAEAPKVISTDPLLVQYVIRDDANWSDGTSIGCDDFRLAALVGSGKYLQKQVNGSTTSAFNSDIVPGYQHATIGCRDARHITVTFDTAEPDWRWLFDSLLPAHILMAQSKVSDLSNLDDAAVLRLAATYNTGFSVAKDVVPLTVSGGPFKVSSVSPEGLLLVPNTKFWAAPPAANGGILVKTIPVDAQLDALRNGDIQIAGLPADASKLDAIRAGTGAVLSQSSPVILTEIVINFGKPELQQRGVRQALSACIDRPSLVSSRVNPVLPEAVAADNRLLAAGEPGIRPTNLAVPVGVDKAKALLTKVGYSFGANGLAERNGRTLTFTLYYDPAGSLGQSVAEALATQCAPAGLSLLPTPDRGDVTQGGPWDLALLSGSGEQSLRQRTARYNGGAADIGRYATPRVNSLLQQAGSALTDADFTESLNAIDETLWADVATVPLYRAPSLVVSASAVAGVAATPGSSGLFGSARAWR